MLKTYQFKTHCKGDSHSSKTANIILTGLVTKTKENALICASELIFKFNCTMLAETLCIVYYKTTWKPTSLCPQLHTYLHKQAQQTCLGVLRCLDGLLRRSAFTRKIRSTWTSAILHCSCVPTNSYHIITHSIYIHVCVFLHCSSVPADNYIITNDTYTRVIPTNMQKYTHITVQW